VSTHPIHGPPSIRQVLSTCRAEESAAATPLLPPPMTNTSVSFEVFSQETPKKQNTNTKVAILALIS